MSLLLVAVLGPLAVAIGTAFQIYVTGVQRRKEQAVEAALRREEKQADWARQDQVANRLTERQDAIARQAAEAARLLVVNNELVAETSASQGAQLDVIHTLVNSTLTGAKQATLEALQGQLLLLERFTPEDADLIDAAQAAIAELRAELSDRTTQTEIADSQSQEATP